MQDAPAAKSGLFDDLLEVFTAPSTVFDRTRAASAGKYVLVTALIVGVIAIATKNLLMPWLDAQSNLQIALAAAKDKPIPEAAVASMRSFTAWGIVIGAPVTMIIGPYLNAAFMKLGAAITKTNISFGQAATIATLAGMPRILGWISLPVQTLVLDESKAKSLADLSLGPARLVDALTTPPAVLTLLSNLDVFRLWQIALVAIGVSVVARVGKGTGVLIAVVMVAIGALIQLIPSALF